MNGKSTFFSIHLKSISDICMHAYIDSQIQQKGIRPLGNCGPLFGFKMERQLGTSCSLYADKIIFEHKCACFEVLTLMLS